MSSADLRLPLGVILLSASYRQIAPNGPDKFRGLWVRVPRGYDRSWPSQDGFCPARGRTRRESPRLGMGGRSSFEQAWWRMGPLGFLQNAASRDQTVLVRRSHRLGPPSRRALDGFRRSWVRAHWLRDDAAGEISPWRRRRARTTVGSWRRELRMRRGALLHGSPVPTGTRSRPTASGTCPRPCRSRPPWPWWASSRRCLLVPRGLSEAPTATDRTAADLTTRTVTTAAPGCAGGAGPSAS